MVLEYTFGQMVENMKDNGKMGSSMEKASTHQQMEKLEEAFGKKGNESSGLTNNHCNKPKAQMEDHFLRFLKIIWNDICTFILLNYE